jgi:hypothetical protein
MAMAAGRTLDRPLSHVESHTIKNSHGAVIFAVDLIAAQSVTILLEMAA